MTTRIIFVDSNVTEYQSLILQLPADSEVFVLDKSQDGIVQILAALQCKPALSAIDIISHGKPGALMLGAIEINNTNLTDYAGQLNEIGTHLGDNGDILLYGCEVAQGKQGRAFVEQLATLTQANIAASTNLTGAAELGGDWVLAARIGAIKSSAMQLSYSGVLQGIVGTPGNDVLNGTNGNDTFEGKLGNDTLNGNYGRDIAIFSGNQVDYEFSLNASGLITVRDINTANGDEGTDTLSSIEIARFIDGDIEIKPPAEEFLVNTHTTNGQENPSITALTDGGFVVSWQSEDLDGSNYDIYAQRYDASGAPQGGEFLVNTYTLNDQESPAITALADGGFVVSWQSSVQDDSNNGIYAQRYDASGAPQDDKFRVNTHTANHQVNPSIAALTDGGFVVIWQSEAQDSHGYGIYAQRYNANGAPQDGELQVNTTTAYAQFNPSITALTDGGFIVSWQSENQDGSGYGIYAQRFTASGNKQDGEFPVNTHTADHQSHPAITGLTDGGFVVSWQSCCRIVAGGVSMRGAMMPMV